MNNMLIHTDLNTIRAISRNFKDIFYLSARRLEIQTSKLYKSPRRFFNPQLILSNKKKKRKKKACLDTLCLFALHRYYYKNCQCRRKKYTQNTKKGKGDDKLLCDLLDGVPKETAVQGNMRWIGMGNQRSKVD